MKAHPEILQPLDLLSLRQHFQLSIGDHNSTWSLSSKRWLTYLMDGRAGTVATCEPATEVREKILTQLSNYLVDFVDPEVFLVLWPTDLKAIRRPSLATTHEAFLFLNESWDISDGGLLLWDIAHSGANCGLPRPGTLIVADQDDFFVMSPSSTTSKEPRMFVRIVSKERLHNEEEED